MMLTGGSPTMHPALVNELTSLPRPTHRRAEVLIKLVYLQGRQDEEKRYKYYKKLKYRKYNKESLN